jgi:hypothetical protein
MTAVAHDPHHATRPESIRVRILRQAAPGESPHWERFSIPYEPNLNIISVLLKIAAQPHTEDGTKTTPVAWDCNYNAHQRPRAAVVLGAGRQPA